MKNVQKELEDLPKSEHYPMVVKELSQLKTGSLVLDAGCGFGRWVFLAGKMGFEACGVDTSDLALRAAKNYSPGTGGSSHFMATDIRMIPFSSGSVNYVLSFGAVEHFRDTAGAIREFYRVLADGGKCFVTTPNTNSFHGVVGNSLRKALRRKDLGYLGYEDSYTPLQLSTMMKKAGFRNVDYGTIPTGLLLGGFYAFIPAIGKYAMRCVSAMSYFIERRQSTWGFQSYSMGLKSKVGDSD